MAISFVDVHPQTIAATLAVRSVPQAATQAVVVILGPRAVFLVVVQELGFLPFRLADGCLQLRMFALDPFTGIGYVRWGATLLWALRKVLGVSVRRWRGHFRFS